VRYPHGQTTASALYSLFANSEYGPVYHSRRNPQIVLKPQDLVVLLRLSLAKEQMPSYAALASELGMTASEVHAALERAHAARLVRKDRGSPPALLRDALRQFVLHGAAYAFPAVRGEATRGLPTAYAAAPLRDLIAQPAAEPPPVWPHPKGAVRGAALYPLYPSVPGAAAKNAALYELLALFDALRSGAARERKLATDLLSERLG